MLNERAKLFMNFRSRMKVGGFLGMQHRIGGKSEILFSEK
jgi:hypothetical protein